jgi:hypothetical protein
MSFFIFCHRHRKALFFTIIVLAISGVAMLLHLPV